MGGLKVATLNVGITEPSLGDVKSVLHNACISNKNVQHRLKYVNLI